MFRLLSRGIWIADNLLSSYNCNNIIEAAITKGFHRSKLQYLGRNNNENTLLNSDVFNNVHRILDEQVIYEDNMVYKLRSPSKKVECYCYQEGDFVAVHGDAFVELDEGVWSSLTLVLYLNDDFLGGETVFPETNLNISPVRGRGLLFRQNILHEASMVSKGIKYIARLNIVMDMQQ